MCIVGLSFSLPAKAPDFTLKDINNKTVSSSDLYGNYVILIEFWSIPCEPCKKQLPKMDALLEKYGDKGFMVISMAIDSVRTQSNVKPYVNGQGYSFITLLDFDQKVYKAFHAPGEPYTVIIDRDGNIAYTHLGYNAGDERNMEAVVCNLLGIEGTWDTIGK
ncbi:MAG: peroxiredoxin family protein [bacterium]